MEYKNNNFDANDFLSLFCAECSIRRDKQFNKTLLVEFINMCRKDNMFDNLLSDSVVLKLDSAFSKLQDNEMIYSSNNNSFIIDVNLPVAAIIERKVPYYCEMVDFYMEYTKYMCKRQSDTYEKMYEQDGKDIKMAVKCLEKFRNKKGHNQS